MSKIYELDRDILGEVLAELDVYRKGESYQETAGAILGRLAALDVPGGYAPGQRVEFRLGPGSGRWRPARFECLAPGDAGLALVLPDGLDGDAGSLVTVALGLVRAARGGE